MQPRNPIRIGDATLGRHGAYHRLTASVDGAPVWFESSDAELSRSGEALATAFLIPALLDRRRLVIEAPVCPRWLANVTRMLPTLREWWRTPILVPQAPLAMGESRPRAPSTGLCFGGGVDSLHTLLRPVEPIHRLVTVHGFDIPLADEARMAAFAESVSAVAADRSLGSIVIRTNLREHPLFRATPWERTHGGALAAIGHLLHDTLGRLLISSSMSVYSRHKWWGSHWTIDPLWSSDRLEVANIGKELHRGDKLRQIAGEPLAERHLRVCWENRSRLGNCSRCEKCLQTMLVLTESGVLDRYSVFEGGGQLVERVAALPRLKSNPGAFEHLAANGRLAPGLLRALRDLVRRTRRERSPLVRARRAVLRALRPLWRGARRQG